MGDVLVVAEHLNGEITDITHEMLGLAGPLAENIGGSCTALLTGGTPGMAAGLGAADKVYAVEAESDFNPETHLAALRAVVEAKSPRVVMVASTAMGMDLAAPLAAQMNLPLAAYCTRVEVSGGSLRATSQLYGGKMNVTSDLGEGPCVLCVIPGAYSAEEGRKEGEPAVESFPTPQTPAKVRFQRLILPEAGDVDITASEVLVAIGRGIGKKEDIEVAQELAEALGAALAASRPIIDAGWLPRLRQVGKSGLKVKPKVYLALGISGAPEHIEGMKSSATIIAVNTDKNAPIFDVAHYGLVADLFDACEEMMEALG